VYPSQPRPEDNSAGIEHLALKARRHLAFRRRIDHEDRTQPGQVDEACRRIRGAIRRRATG